MKSKTAKILGILVSVLVLFASCGQLMNDGESTVSVNLPYVNNGNSRAISSEDIQRIKGDHASYRVHINDRVLEGTGGNFSATFPVGVRVDVFIECVNAKGEVILRTVTKSIVVASGGNDIDFNLKEDGTEIIPESQKGRVIYTYGEAESKPGDKGGLPADNTIYRPGDTFTVQNGGSMTWTHATAFTGWKTNVALTGDTNASVGNVDAGGDVQLGGTYIMPEGGVVLMAQWQKRTYRIEYNDNASNSGGMQTTSQMPSTENITALENATIPSVDLQPVNANGKNYTFTGYWLTDSNGTDGKRYRAGDTIPMTADITLYAQWSDRNVHTVTYDKGSGPSVDNITNWKANDTFIEGNAAITLPTLSTTGYRFDGWKLSTGGDLLPATYTPTATVTLTAQWTAIEYTISVNGNGASGLDNPFAGQTYTIDGSVGSQSLSISSSTPSNANTVYSGKVFDGWSLTQSGAKESADQSVSQVLENGTVSGNIITLYAVWTDAVASVTIDATETNYATFADAFSAANNNTATIKLFKDDSDVAVTMTGGTITLNLNGKTLTGNPDEFQVIKIIGRGTSLTLIDPEGGGKITNGSTGVKVDESAAFTMEGGTITANGTRGVSVTGTSSTFNMKGGTISENHNNNGYGGGVYISESATFTMEEGTITGNSSSSGGGGVYISGNTVYNKFEMRGGTISGNTSSTGGAVYVDQEGTFIMNGGTIESNEATSTSGFAIGGGGVYLPTSAAKFQGNGTGTFKNNTPNDYRGDYTGTATANSNSWTHD